MENAAKKLAVEYFKRNRQAIAVHVVLDRVTDNLKKAKLFQKSCYAKKVTTILRQECALELGEENKSESLPLEN